MDSVAAPRRLALALVVLTATVGVATATAGTTRRAGTTVSRTLACTTGAGALRISGTATIAGTQYASAGIGTGAQAANKWLVVVDTRYKNYESDVCKPVKARVALTHRGLTSAGVSLAGQYRGGAEAFCSAPPHVLLRFRLAFDPSGIPVAATMVVTTPRRKTIGFVQWSPKRSVMYYSSACTTG